MLHFFIYFLMKYVAKRKKNCMMISKQKKVKSGLQFYLLHVGHLCVHLSVEQVNICEGFTLLFATFTNKTHRLILL